MKGNEMTEGTWISTDFPPESPGVYRRRTEAHDEIGLGNYHGNRLAWTGTEWRWTNGGPTMFQDGEYLLPPGAWALTKGQPVQPVADDVCVEVRFKRTYCTAIQGPAERWGWGPAGDHEIIAFRLAVPLVAEQECLHRDWNYSLAKCRQCGTTGKQLYEQRESAAVMGDDTAPAECPSEGALLQSDSHPPRRDRFGLLNKWPEVRPARVPHDLPASAMIVWKER